MRTRDGVVDLAEWRAALPAVEFLRSAHGHHPLLLDVRLVPSGTVGFELELILAREAPEIRMCLPRAVNDIPVRVVVLNPDRASRPVSTPSVPSGP